MQQLPNRGPGVLGSGRGKRQHGLVRATIKARCQLLEEKKTTFWAAFARAQRTEQDACGPMGDATLDLCVQTLTGAEPRSRFSMTFISDMLSETNAKRGRSLPHCQLTSSTSYTLLLLLILFPCLFVFIVYRTTCPEILTGPSVDLTSPGNTYKKIQTCLNQAFTCSTMASTLGDWWW